MPNDEIKTVKSTRSDIDAKIKREAKSVYDAASADDLTNFHSEASIKCQLRDDLLDISMTDEMLAALSAMQNPLEDAYRFYCASDKMNQTYLAMFEFLDKVEHDFVADKLYNIVKTEYDTYLNKVKAMPPDEIIKEAYKITTLYDIQIMFDPETSTLSTEQMKAICSLDDPLWCMYNEWQRRDITHMDDIADAVKDVADKQAAELNESKVDPIIAPDCETEEGYEP